MADGGGWLRLWDVIWSKMRQRACSRGWCKRLRCTIKSCAPSFEFVWLKNSIAKLHTARTDNPIGEIILTFGEFACSIQKMRNSRFETYSVESSCALKV